MKYYCVFLSVFVCACVTPDWTTAEKCPITSQPNRTFVENLSYDAFCHFTDLNPREAYKYGVCDNGKQELGKLNCCKSGNATRDADCGGDCLGNRDSPFVDTPFKDTFMGIEYTNKTQHPINLYGISCSDRNEMKSIALQVYEECTKTDGGPNPTYANPCSLFRNPRFTLSKAMYILKEFRNLLTREYSSYDYKIPVMDFASRCFINLNRDEQLVRWPPGDVDKKKKENHCDCSYFYRQENRKTINIDIFFNFKTNYSDNSIIVY